MRYLANTALIRAGAQKFATAAIEMRQKAVQIENSVDVLIGGADGWRGRGADAYQNAAQHINEDIKTSSDAFQRAATVLSTLAAQLDQVNQYRQHANQLEDRIHSLQSELWSADEYRRESIRDQIPSLRYKLNDYDRQADFIENQANRMAGLAFDDIGTMVNRLYFGQGTSVQDRVGEFFAGLWGKAKDAVELVGDELEEVFDDTTHFLKEKYKEAQEGGLLGMFIGFFEGMGQSLLDTIEGLWSLTPSAVLYKAVTDWEGTKEKAAKIFYEYTHPIETAEARLAFIKGIPAIAKVVASTVVDSVERDLINGNAYTRSKWAGYAAGMVIESVGTFGAPEIGQAAKLTIKAEDVVKYYGELHTLDRFAGQSFHSQIDDVLIKHGTTAEEFYQLRRTRTHRLSQDQADLLKNIRAEVPIPAYGQIVQKVIPGSSVELLLSQKPFGKVRNDWTHNISGFFARTEDVAHLRTPQELFDALALHYKKTRFKYQDEAVGALRFPIKEVDVSVPFGGSRSEGVELMGGSLRQQWPFTGNGFSASRAHVMPEFTMERGRIPHGTQLWEIRKDGTEALKGVYDHNVRQFVRVIE